MLSNAVRARTDVAIVPARLPNVAGTDAVPGLRVAFHRGGRHGAACLPGPVRLGRGACVSREPRDRRRGAGGGRRLSPHHPVRWPRPELSKSGTIASAPPSSPRFGFCRPPPPGLPLNASRTCSISLRIFRRSQRIFLETRTWRVSSRRGRRCDVLRGWDRFEVAVRSIIGQQVTVARARLLNGILVERCGSWLRDGIHDRPGRVFPTPQQVVDADLATMGMPGARVTALKSVASAVLADPNLFDRASSVDETTARLRAIRGIGDWTAHYIAMRACGEPDAFPASDVGLLRGAADRTGRRPSPDELLARAEPWRPWRAYAAHQLWALDGARALDSTARDGVPAASRSVIVSE